MADILMRVNGMVRRFFNFSRTRRFSAGTAQWYFKTLSSGLYRSGLSQVKIQSRITKHEQKDSCFVHDVFSLLGGESKLGGVKWKSSVIGRRVEASPLRASARV